MSYSYKFPLESISVGDVVINPHENITHDTLFGVFGPQLDPSDERCQRWKSEKRDMYLIPNTPFTVLQSVNQKWRWYIFTIRFSVTMPTRYPELNDAFGRLEDFLHRSSTGFHSLSIDDEPLYIGGAQLWAVLGSTDKEIEHRKFQFYLDPIAKGVI